jgi:hypothetical protein
VSTPDCAAAPLGQRTLTEQENADLQMAAGLQQVCLAAGASLSTALIVPGLFVQQLERDRARA